MSVRAGGSIRCGIAGWSYDDWRGVVYPRGCRDPLRFCAEFVDYIEVNSTFYQIPVARNCASWVERVDGLPTLFSAKLPREFTHDLLDDPDLVAATRAGFAPLAASGRLRTLLAQFSYRFACTEANVAHLGWICDQFVEVAPLTVEVRHRSWAETRGLDVLRGLGVAVAHLDYAGADSGFGLDDTGLHGSHGLAYLRLHGRNQAWFDKEAGRDQVYDYEYPAAEVEGIAARAARLARAAQETVVIGNNHFQGKAMKVVVELLAHLEDRGEVPVPEPLVRTYPSLAAIARRPPGMLF